MKSSCRLPAAATAVMATAGLMTMLVCAGGGCGRRRTKTETATGGRAAVPKVKPKRPSRLALAPLATGEVYRYDDKKAGAATRLPEVQARSEGRLVVDLSDGWAPFIFQDSGTSTGSAPPLAKNDAPTPNGYRQTFVDLANDRINADGRALDQGTGEHNFLEPFGIPPTLSVLRARIEYDLSPERQACLAHVDSDGLRAFTGNVAYLDREHARRDHAEATRDAVWLKEELAKRKGSVGSPGGKGANGAGALAALRADPDTKVRARVDRAVRGQARVRAVRAVQARLVCEGMLTPRARFIDGMFDLPTHEALAEWERKNDIFGWASLGGETSAALLRPALELHLETLRRIFAERVADAAGIVEDGSTAKWKNPPTYADAKGGAKGAARSRPVPNLIQEHVAALLANLKVATPEDMVDFLRQHASASFATLRVAMVAPPLPPYYRPDMELSAEIDRGDVWYDFPFDARGRLVEQPRQNYPHLTLFVHWQGQKIPLCWWRTTIGSWRSELNANGKIYYKYKNSDVGARFWKNIVAGPVWVPPDATPAKDLLTRKVLDRNKGSELVVNTEVMGPGFQSAYGLVMAIHIDRSGFDNQIRTHGSVDYTSIARRFSHGCHRLVNNRAVRLYDFVLRRQAFRRLGSMPLGVKRSLVVDGKPYAFELKSRGYYYELLKPIAVTVLEGRVMGKVKAPVLAYVRKAGVDYSEVDRAAAAGAADRAGALEPGISVSGGDGSAAIAPAEDPATPDTSASLRIPQPPPAAASGADSVPDPDSPAAPPPLGP